MLRFNTGDMFPNKVYEFRVLGEKAPGREAEANFTLSVLPAAAPNISI